VSLRPIVMLVLLFAGLSSSAFAQNLKVRVEGDRLRVSGPKLHFLSGRALDRLLNGGAVVYAVQLVVRSERGGRVLSRQVQRFTFSYDLWEEKVAVSRLDFPARSASNLSTAAAESWCLENLSIAASELPQARSFWVGLEYETEEAKDSGKSDGSGLTLSGLIDIFSRSPRDMQQVRGSDEVGPFSLDDLKKKSR
jgi:hypothetical protein